MIDARPQRQLGRRENLGVQPANLRDHAKHGASRRAPVQPMPVRSEERNLLPRNPQGPSSTREAIERHDVDNLAHPLDSL